MPHDGLPPDPFAGDPQDPTLAMDALDGADDGAVTDELTNSERAEVIADIADLAVYQTLLEPRGIRGIAVDCPDCGEPHLHEWGLLRASLQQLLDEGQMRQHEPAFAPDPAQFVTWEYCRGFTDAVLSND